MALGEEPTMPPSRDPTAGDRPAPESIRLRLSPEARDALSAALSDRPSGSGIRIWVERGMHPHAQMMVDRPSARDIPLSVDGVTLLVDEASVSFLRDAEVRYRQDADPPGFEVTGPFLPARPAQAPPSAPEPGPSRARAGDGHADAEEKVREALKSVYDPEIPMNIVDLGLLYGFDWGADGSLTIRMTMTSPGCPAVEELVREVERTARAPSGARSVRVEVVWEPPWGPERMTDFARRQFGYA
jgi:metal-sulfur cluster biosynthetic enzyme/Fe-S cluster assembly iron-binding protein IscA